MEVVRRSRIEEAGLVDGSHPPGRLCDPLRLFQSGKGSLHFTSSLIPLSPNPPNCSKERKGQKDKMRNGKVRIWVGRGR